MKITIEGDLAEIIALFESKSQTFNTLAEQISSYSRATTCDAIRNAIDSSLKHLSQSGFAKNFGEHSEK